MIIVTLKTEKSEFSDALFVKRIAFWKIPIIMPFSL